MTRSANRGVAWGRYRRSPAIQARVVSSTCIEDYVLVITAPNDHFTTGPDCSMADSATRSVTQACSSPIVTAGIVSSACVYKVNPIKTTPDQHFNPCPHRRVRGSARGRIGGACGCPVVRSGIISAARVQLRATPNDHFAASPNSGMGLPWNWGVHHASCNPAIRIRIVSPAGVEGPAKIPTPYNHLDAAPDGSVPCAGVRSVRHAS